MRKLISIAFLVGSLVSNGIWAAEESTEAGSAMNEHAMGSMDMSSFNFPNPFDPTTWHDKSGELKTGTTIPIQPLSPVFWSNFANPEMHSKMHMAFTNPAQYMQFMDPQFYMQFMNPANYMAMMNPQSYAVFMDPNTWTYWMQPGAYMHGMDMNAYMQMMNPAAYMGFMNPESAIAMAPGSSTENSAINQSQ